jgi:NAD+ synthase
MNVFVRALLEQTKRENLSAELILIEWNPPSDRPRLREVLSSPNEEGTCDVRVIEVPPEVHARFRYSDRLPMFQMIAKNVGIRRAKGRFVLPTSSCHSTLGGFEGSTQHAKAKSWIQIQRPCFRMADKLTASLATCMGARSAMPHSGLDLDWDTTVQEIVAFIRRIVTKAEAKGVVIGLSGGVDSSLVAALSVKALGKERVLGILLPTDFTPDQDIQDAMDLAKLFEIRTECIMITPITASFAKALKVEIDDSRVRIPLANIVSRTRMIILYHYANTRNYLVAGTGDRSEDLIGYFTKYGDGGADLLPICHLYKTQVRRLAEYLGIPSRMAFKPSSPQLYPGHKATDEIPIDYDKLDPVERMLFDEKLSSPEVAEKTQVDIKVILDVLKRHRSSAHKRCYPPMLREW